MSRVNPDSHSISPDRHPAFGPGNLFSAIHSGVPLQDFPAFTPGETDPVRAHQPVIGAMAHLADYNHRIGNTFSQALRDKLSHGAPLLIAGQQPGLMTGPLYTIWKLLTVIILAGELHRDFGFDLVPAFWIASEDHDILEVNRFNCGGSTFVAEPDFPAVRGQLRPVGMIPLHARRDALLAFLSHNLHGLPWMSWLLDLAASCDYSNYSRLFSSFALNLLGTDHDIVFIDALEARQLTAPFLATAVERLDEVNVALGRGAELLKSAGFMPPLNDCGLFEILEGDIPARIKCGIEDAGIRYSGGVVPAREMSDLIRGNPERFSAGAALRPVLQDAVFHVAVTVGGPSELLYLWQIDSVYNVMRIERSRLLPRLSATILPSSVQSLVARFGGLQEAVTAVGELTAHTQSGHDPAIDGLQDEDLDHLDAISRELTGYLSILKEADPIILEKAINSIRHQVGKVAESVGRKRRQTDISARRRVERFRELLMPGGKAQERVMNVCEPLAHWGPDWIAWMVDTLRVRQNGHQIITMP